MYLTTSKRRLNISFALVLALCTTAAHAAGGARILIYSRTTGFRHDSIPTAINALQTHGQSINVDFDATEDPAQFTDGNLAQYDSLLFLSTTGDVLDDTGAGAFQKYLNRGGTFIGIHSASDTLRNQTFYANELGALFDYHPVLQNFTVNIIGPSHPSTTMLPTRWTVQDEAYNFDSDPRAIGATVILSADESTYTDTGVHKNQGSPHPTAWFQEQGAGVEPNGTAGRSFYTSLGHLNETWQVRENKLCQRLYTSRQRTDFLLYA
jgi:type 1 glutamine amidotransferase